jgi:hypothetical protein
MNMVALVTQEILTVENMHFPDCGTPPQIRRAAKDGRYVSYFEGQSGDQWLFVAEFRTNLHFQSH